MLVDARSEVRLRRLSYSLKFFVLSLDELLSPFLEAKGRQGFLVFTTERLFDSLEIVLGKL